MKTHQTNNTYNLTPLSVTPPDNSSDNPQSIVIEPDLSSNSISTAPSVKAVRDGINIIAFDVAGKAPLVSPSFTGIPIAPTPAPTNNSNALATTAYVTLAVNTANIGGVTKGYVDNADSAIQGQLSLKEAFISAGTSNQYYRGDKTFQTLDKTAIGLSNVDNTSDINKPISLSVQGALNLKADIGSFSNIDNTSDINKPISTLTQNALNLKVNTGSLGSSAFKNIPLSGNAGNDEVVMGNDSRLSNNRTDDNAVHKTGSETIAGAKTFTSNLFINNANLTVTGVVESSGGFKYSDGSIQTTAAKSNIIEQDLSSNSTTAVPSIAAVKTAITATSTGIPVWYSVNINGVSETSNNLSGEFSKYASTYICFANSVSTGFTYLASDARILGNGFNYDLIGNRLVTASHTKIIDLNIFNAVIGLTTKNSSIIGGTLNNCNFIGNFNYSTSIDLYGTKIISDVDIYMQNNPVVNWYGTPDYPNPSLPVGITYSGTGVINIIPWKATDFVPITNNQFGTHPAFATQMELNQYILSRIAPRLES